MAKTQSSITGEQASRSYCNTGTVMWIICINRLLLCRRLAIILYCAWMCAKGTHEVFAVTLVGLFDMKRHMLPEPSLYSWW